MPQGPGVKEPTMWGRSSGPSVQHQKLWAKNEGPPFCICATAPIKFYSQKLWFSRIATTATTLGGQNKCGWPALATPFVCKKCFCCVCKLMFENGCL